jgi:hypothetical protein
VALKREESESVCNSEKKERIKSVAAAAFGSFNEYDQKIHSKKTKKTTSKQQAAAAPP